MTVLTVFSGPTLSHAAVRDHLGEALPTDQVRIRPPAAQGDVLRELHDPPRIIVLIDGVYERQPAIWHKELLWAMEQGVTVMGASSMGALRAVELEPFGMIGVGEVVRLFAAGQLRSDADVAVAHLDGENEWRRVSEALVDVRATCQAALVMGVIDASLAEAVIDAAGAMFYAERSWPALLAQVPRTESLKGWLAEGGGINLKENDARLALDEAVRRVREQLSAPPTIVGPVTAHLQTALFEAGFRPMQKGSRP